MSDEKLPFQKVTSNEFNEFFMWDVYMNYFEITFYWMEFL